MNKGTLIIYAEIFIGVMLLMYLTGAFITWDLSWVTKEGFGQVAKFMMVLVGLCVAAPIAVMVDNHENEPE